MKLLLLLSTLALVAQSVDLYPRRAATFTTLPATCTVGETAFKSDAAAGQNWYGCTATDTWTLQAGGGGTGTLPGATNHTGKYLTNDGTNAYWQRIGTGDIGDCAPTISGGTLGIAACAARNGTLDVTVSQCTASLTGTSSSGTVYGYLSVDGTFTLGHSAAATLSCGAWNVLTNISAFPDDALPLFTATFSANAWNTAGISNYRRMIARDPMVAGTGLQAISNSATGITTLQVDGSVIPRYFTGAGTPGFNCTQGRDFYLDTTTGTLYQCTATNIWSGISGGGGGGSATITARRYPVWGLLPLNGGNPTGAFTANETRWQQFHLPVAMTVSGIGLRAWTGLGASKGVRFAIANTGGTILYKTNVLTTCASYSLCEAALASSVTIPAGVYYLGLTTDSTSLQTGQLATLVDGTPVCAKSEAGTNPKIAGTGTPGSGSAASVDFAASMGTLTTYSCNAGANNLVLKFHDMYLF